MLEDKDNYDRIEELWFNDSTVKINIRNGEIGYGQGNILKEIIKNTSIKQ